MGTFSKRLAGETTDRTTERRDDAHGRGIDPGSVAAGAKGGVIGTVAMTVFRMPVADSLPPTARFYAKFFGSGGPEDYPLRALVLHLLYGAAAGAVFGALPVPDRSGSTLSNERRGALAGVAYGLALSVFGERALLRALLDMDPDPDERFVFHVGHVVYGLVLGTAHGSAMGERAEREG